MVRFRSQYTVSAKKILINRVKLSQAQWRLKLEIEANGFINDDDIQCGLERSTIKALERKNIVIKEIDDDGFYFWCLT